MAIGARAGWIMVGLAGLVAAGLAWAWHDGGVEPVHQIVVKVNVPEAAR